MGMEKADLLVKLPDCQLTPPPPPPPPRPRWSSYTRREIERFWRKKRLEEEEHFLAAVKAAARLRASHFSEEDYRIFLESLDDIMTKEKGVTTIAQKKGCGNNQEIRVGIKDWWKKSKYAYLNQPAEGSVGRPIRRSNYKPEKIWFYNKPSSIANVSAHQALYPGVY